MEGTTVRVAGHSIAGVSLTCECRCACHSNPVDPKRKLLAPCFAAVDPITGDCPNACRQSVSPCVPFVTVPAISESEARALAGDR